MRAAGAGRAGGGVSAGPVLRAEPPVGGAVRPYAFPAVVHQAMANGMTVVVVHKPGAPVVSAMVVLRGGETAVETGSDGLAVLAAHALEGGTERLSGVELARSLEDIGATFGAGTGWDSTTVALSCMPRRLGQALPLLGEVVRTPAFDDKEFGRHRAQRLAVAAHRRMDPGALAEDAFARLVFADGDTYARALGGTEETLRDLTQDDAHRFAATRYGPAQSALLIVGDIDGGEALAHAEAAFGDWDARSAPIPTASARDRRREPTLHVVHRPGSVQSEIKVGHVGVSRLVEDYTPLTVMNLVLGGSFMSRLNVSLRETHGFTYGVHSSFAARRGRGPFAVSTAVENKVTAAAVREIHREIRKMAATGPMADEVGQATSYLAGVFPLRLEAVAQIASRIAGLVVFDLPFGHYQGYRERVRAVTQRQAAEAARRHLRPDRLCTVVVGDADEVAKSLEDLAIGPVTVHG